MTTNIQLLRSSVAYKRPSAAPLLDGQAAINLNAAEPGLFWRLTNGQLAKAGPVAITDNGMQPNAAPAGETGNTVGEEWLDAHPALHAPILHIFNGTEFVTANGFTVDKSTGNLTLLRQLEVTKVLAGEGQINGKLEVGGNITPQGQNCAFYLGLPNERWDYLYSCNFNTSFDGTVGRHLTVKENATVEGNLSVDSYVGSNLTPDLDATRHLGEDARRWIGWFSSLNVNGSMQLGNSCSDSLTVNATTTFKCPVTFEGGLSVPDASLDDLNIAGDIVLGDGCASSTINLNGAITLSCDMLPSATNTRSIGSTANKLKEVHATDVYTGDLHLKNDKGDWTMIEAEDYMTLRNNKTGKTFRLMMEEI